ncbi:hypothetical protein Dimus_036211 [Dionaea muscipula]
MVLGSSKEVLVRCGMLWLIVFEVAKEVLDNQSWLNLRLGAGIANIANQTKLPSNPLHTLQLAHLCMVLKCYVVSYHSCAIVACAIPWLRSLLLQHASFFMSQESSLVALNSLYQLIESSSFNSSARFTII